MFILCKKNVLSLLFTWSFLIVSGSASAEPSSKPARFIFTIPVKEVVVTATNKTASDGEFRVVLKGVDKQVPYTIFPPINQGGYVETAGLINLWSQWQAKVKVLLPVVLQQSDGVISLGLKSLKQLSPNSWTAIAENLQGDSVPQSHAALKPGSYRKATLLSDMLPVNILSIPRSRCRPSMSMKDCQSQALKIQ